jgi:dipeptidyl aminopeptidase/acylaminoacyl peptidase
MRYLLCILLALACLPVIAQKKTLDHSVYDAWESVGERKLSNNGEWIAFTKAVQEGDNLAVVQSTKNVTSFSIPRGYNIRFTESASHAILLIAPAFQEVRTARIQKKKPEDMPKDSLAIIDLAKGSIRKIARVRTYELPKQADGLIAWHHVRAIDTSKKATTPDAESGADLVMENLHTGTSSKAPGTIEFAWSKNGKLLALETRYNRSSKETTNAVVLYRFVENRFDTICYSGNEFGNFAIDEQAYQVAFTAERDSSRKALVKTHKLWYWKNGMDTAVIAVDRNHTGMQVGLTVSENRKLQFNTSGSRIFFGLAPIRPIPDTSIPEIDRVKLDIWHYNDDRLQPQQLLELNADLKRSYLALYDVTFRSVLALGNEYMKTVIIPENGEGELAIGISDTSHRKDMQWTGEMSLDVYALNLRSGQKQLVTRGISSMPQLSPAGKFIAWYDDKRKHFFTWKEGQLTNLSQAIPYKLFDEEHDTPSDPPPYARMRWLRNDAGVLLQDRYDLWKLSPDGKRPPISITKGEGRKNKIRYSYAHPAPDEDWLPDSTDRIYVRIQHEQTKESGYAQADLSGKQPPVTVFYGPYAYSPLAKAAKADVLAYTRETFVLSPQLMVRHSATQESIVLATNPHQQNYNWGTAELFHWKAYNGLPATGMVFKPENFDPARKYPMISYFYERDSDGLFQYRAPSPTRSRLDISFFVSRGYVVFVPDIHYKKGYPGKGAYDYIVSGARALVKKGWVDSTRMGIQGQSWGGYQVCYLITRTNLFAAAWAGAPVGNMTSAYGGIRWGSGLNRQFQYEKTQSRIGATLWEKPELYIENSPLFKVPAIKTPLVIMANDEDDAVPWYQGIELFTAMRRVGKQVWMLNYNGEKHNLVDRKNRKDLSIREQQYFDWLLKGEKAPRWLTDGVPATEKQNVNR